MLVLRRNRGQSIVIGKHAEIVVKILKEVNVDEILITDVYAAREKGDKKILAKNV